MFGHDDQQQNHDNNQWNHQDDNQQTDYQTTQDPVVNNNVIAPDINEAHQEPQHSTNQWDQPQTSQEPAHSEAASDDLLAIKQKALEDLSPLVGHLNQSPEEKFNTTLMMIKATDNKSLLPEAYKAAQEITDEKKKAQALLDIINEVNYFTQKAS